MKKIRVTQYRINMYTTQYRFWDGYLFLGMREVFLWDVTEYPAASACSHKYRLRK